MREAAARPVGAPAPRQERRHAAVAAHRHSLDLHVKVAKDWQRDPKQLRRLGF
ncbi:hypothetical protein [Streptomyces sp. NPDC020571]|uniref:hypothetical protein n=1 Tax=Streptomyces sp. NPDC020571 TaxID=3365079 RepID=UPI0037956ADB